MPAAILGALCLKLICGIELIILFRISFEKRRFLFSLLSLSILPNTRPNSRQTCKCQAFDSISLARRLSLNLSFKLRARKTASLNFCRRLNYDAKLFKRKRFSYKHTHTKKQTTHNQTHNSTKTTTRALLFIATISSSSKLLSIFVSFEFLPSNSTLKLSLSLSFPSILLPVNVGSLSLFKMAAHALEFEFVNTTFVLHSQVLS